MGVFSRWRRLIGPIFAFVVASASAVGAARAATTGKGAAFSIVHVADPRGNGAVWRKVLTEVRDRKGHSPLPAAEVLIVAGDFDPVRDRYGDFVDVFGSSPRRPVFLPVLGNHDLNAGHVAFVRDELIPRIPDVQRAGKDPCSFAYDHRNTRVIVIDSYHAFGRAGVINEAGRDWTEQMITSAGEDIAHVFISFHEPAFPRYRHLRDSFNADVPARDSFWQVLMRHRDKVRAVMVGHTHTYYRMRVADPRNGDGGGTKDLPDEPGGIYQIDAGNAGNGRKATIVTITIKDATVRADVVSGAKDSAFESVDGWLLASAQGVSGGDDRRTRSAETRPALPKEPAFEPTAAETARFDTMLRKRTRAELAGGKGVVYYDSRMRMKSRVISIDETGALTIRGVGLPVTMKISWSVLSHGDKAGLALAVLQSGSKDDHAMAGFYLMAAGRRADAEVHLRISGEGR